MLALFILGLCIGSFLNVVADRLVSNKSFLWGRSHCDFCGTPLLPRDLIPVLSFLGSRGKCRFCGHKISWFYPFSELFVGILFVVAYLLSGLYAGASVYSLSRFVYLLLLFSIYAVLFFTDVKYRLLPRKAIWLGVVLTLLYITYESLWPLGLMRSQGLAVPVLEVFRVALSALAPRVIGALLIGSFFLLLFLVTRGRGMGFGDVRLSLLVGLVHPFPLNVLAVFLSFVFGACVGVVLLLVRRAGLKSQIAFGPFMITASVVVLLWGPKLLRAYSVLLG